MLGSVMQGFMRANGFVKVVLTLRILCGVWFPKCFRRVGNDVYLHAVY